MIKKKLILINFEGIALWLISLDKIINFEVMKKLRNENFVQFVICLVNM
ncbi:MAG: hypothetical protein ACTS42_02160 [Candidatus Hodgkinia cicadicola]